MSWMQLLEWGTAAVCGMMLALWLIHFLIQNAAIVDFGWGLGMAILGTMYALLGKAPSGRALLLGVMTVVAGLRLAFYLLFTRIIGHPEEGRYQELRRQWKTSLGVKFLIFYQFQALLAVLLSIPYLLAAENADPGIHRLEWVAATIWLVGFLGEAISDWQLSAFKSEPENKGRTCDTGLWHYSRHPNYFFQWLIWVSLAVLSSAAPWGGLGWLSPALMLYFLLKVTGIPATEAQALRSRGDEYRRYQRSTSAFIPWFPRPRPEAGS